MQAMFLELLVFKMRCFLYYQSTFSASEEKISASEHILLIEWEIVCDKLGLVLGRLEGITQKAGISHGSI